MLAAIVFDVATQLMLAADRELIAGILRDLASEGCALIVSGHEVSQLLDIADDVVWMTSGTTHGLGAPAVALANDQFRREYLRPLR